MITNLYIKNLGIIEDIEMELDEKLNAITGETGAGKSLIVDAIKLLCGQRFSKEMIRNGCDFLLVECNVFDEKKDTEDKNVVLSRKIYANGKNICKINGELASVCELKKYMQNIVNVYSQNDNMELFEKKNHILYLDNYSNEIKVLKEEYNKYYSKYLNILDELNKNLGDDRERKRTLDLLKYELCEIDEANLTESEEELQQRHKKIINQEKIKEASYISKNLLENNVIAPLEEVIKNFSKLSSYDEEYEKRLEILNESYYNIKDIYEFLYDIQNDLDFDEQKNQEFLKRLDLIHTLKRKYGNSIEDILNYRNELIVKIKKIENMDSYLNSLKNELNITKDKMKKMCEKLNELRIMYAKEISCKINEQLNNMEMKNASIRIDVALIQNEEYNINGLSNVEFMIRTNVGDEFLSLSKIVSGGEMSRIFLAIKIVLADSYNIKTLVFDEIDTGISGLASRKVAAKMAYLSNCCQIICITHLPNITALASSNFYIYKEVKEGVTKTNIKKLNDKEKTCEIARISFGKISDVAIKYAMELQNQTI